MIDSNVVINSPSGVASKNMTGDPLLRQLTEAILIEEKKPLMNAKDEWGNRNIPRKREPGERGSQA